MRVVPAETALDRRDIRDRLDGTLSVHEVELVLDVLPPEAVGVVLYGSVARGDSKSHSDIDVLVVGAQHRRTRTVGNISVSTYGPAQLSRAKGTLFGMHLARDGKILHDSSEFTEDALQAFGPVDAGAVISKVRKIAVALHSDDISRQRYLPGLVRLARYLLRTTLYTTALQTGPPCFSLDGLAERFGDPTLPVLLSSHEAVHGPPTVDKLDELVARLERSLGAIGQNPYLSLEALIVGEWDRYPDAANAALLALSTSHQDLPYAEIPRIVL